MRRLVNKPAGLWLAALMLVAGLGALGGPAATAVDSRDDIEQKRAANQTELDQLQAELEGTSAELTQAYLDLEAARREQPLAKATMEAAQQDYATAQQEFTEISDKLVAAELSHDQVTQQLADDQAEVANARRSLGQMARAVMVSDRSTTNDLMLLLGANDIQDAAQAQMTAQAFSATREAAITKAQQSAGTNLNHQARLEAVTDEIADLKVQAQDALDRAEVAKAEAEAAKEALDRLEASLETLTADLATRKADEEQRQAVLLAEQKTFDDQLAKIVAEERAKAAAEAAAASAGTGTNSGAGAGLGIGTVPDSGAASASGFFGRPVSGGYISSPFGWRTHPIFGGQRFHQGVDYALACGSPLFASAGGTVVQAGWAGGYGYRTVVSHGNVGGVNMMSTYNHQPSIAVSVGQSVAKGEVIGQVGTTGASTGCHLHFEILKDGSPVDPMGYL